jgi:hypothetical protein
MARPKKTINWDLVEKRMEAGNSAKEIAKHLRIDINTFYDRFKEEYKCSFSDFADGITECGIADIVFTQHMKALSGNVQMLIYLGKVKGGQKEPEATMTLAANQTQLDQSHRIMELEHQLAQEREKNGTG